MIKTIATKLDFPKEAVDFLAECEELMEKNAQEMLELAEKSLFTPNDEKYMELLQEISDKSGVNRQVCDMVFLLRCAIPLYDKYKEAGYDDKLYYDTVSDLRYKLFECKATVGVWGMCPTGWFKPYYLLERFKLGRMQYEKISFPFDKDYEGVVKKGDIVLNCHIPSGSPMLEEDIKASLRLAYDFYKENRMSDGRLTVMCFSWLLFPPLFANFKEESNIKKFYNLFEIIDQKEDPKNDNFWRVFGVRYSPEALETVSADNSLRRALIEHIKNGGTMGHGVGILFVDENY